MLDVIHQTRPIGLRSANLEPLVSTSMMLGFAGRNPAEIKISFVSQWLVLEESGPVHPAFPRPNTKLMEFTSTPVTGQ
jgi:hypothetical protein